MTEKPIIALNVAFGLLLLGMSTVVQSSAQTPRSGDVPPNPCADDLRVRDDPGCTHGPKRISDVFIDLASCPLRAEFRDIYDGHYAVLVNHSSKGIVRTFFGYVEPLDGKAHVVDDISAVSLIGATVEPGQWWDGVFPNDDCPCNSWILRRPQAYVRLRVAVIKIDFADGSNWDAEGQLWESRPPAT